MEHQPKVIIENCTVVTGPGGLNLGVFDPAHLRINGTRIVEDPNARGISIQPRG